MRKYIPELIGSGQFAVCANCGLGADKNGHDGCIGEIAPSLVMNACCGHGDIDSCYVQFFSGEIIRGAKAMKFIRSQSNE